MIIELHPNFRKAYRKRIFHNSKLVAQVAKRIEQFEENQNAEVLHSHELKGSKRGLYSFSVDGDVRIVYWQVSNSRVVFLDIGTHNQVY